MSSETYYNLSQASELTKLSHPTLRKYLREGKFPNATQTTKGKVLVWAIPLTDLVAAELLDKVSTPSPDSTEATSLTDRAAALGERLGRLEAENEQLKERVKDLLRRAEFAERVYQNQLETRQAQEARRLSWWQRSTSKQPETLNNPITGQD
jgi:DNA-binding transcriptional MerR regulator